MNAKDLMIGDFISYHDKPYGILGIKSNTEGDYTIKVDCGGLCWWIPVKDVQPIPLTQEILEKNGWIKTDDPFFRFGGVGKEERVTKYIQYVHELQHALRLCGIDKEIVLK